MLRNGTIRLPPPPQRPFSPRLPVPRACRPRSLRPRVQCEAWRVMPLWSVSTRLLRSRPLLIAFCRLVRTTPDIYQERAQRSLQYPTRYVAPLIHHLHSSTLISLPISLHSFPSHPILPLGAQTSRSTIPNTTITFTTRIQDETVDTTKAVVFSPVVASQTLDASLSSLPVYLLSCTLPSTSQRVFFAL